MDLEKWERIHRDIDEQEERETSLCKVQHGARWGLSTGACKEQGRDKAGGDYVMVRGLESILQAVILYRRVTDLHFAKFIVSIVDNALRVSRWGHQGSEIV